LLSGIAVSIEKRPLALVIAYDPLRERFKERPYKVVETTLTAIPGLRLCRAFLTNAQMARLLAAVDREAWRSDLSRRVQHYGYRYDYKKRTVDREDYLGPLPDWMAPLAQRIADEGFMAAVPDQVIVNEYFPGQGIAPHIDCEPCFGPTIVSVSLGSDCVMDFTHVTSNQTHSLLLAEGSLLALEGAARYFWKHGIAKRKSDVVDGEKQFRERRVSLTFRNVVIDPDR
ncbi:MAG: alpha-ketoglutarate-dependent dioxygenase AlkB, partial [Verrucomicrobiales bacterium]